MVIESESESDLLRVRLIIVNSVYSLHTMHSKYYSIHRTLHSTRLFKTRANNSEQMNSEMPRRVGKPATDHQMPHLQGCQCEGSAIASAEWD